MVNVVPISIRPADFSCDAVGTAFAEPTAGVLGFYSLICSITPTQWSLLSVPFANSATIR